MLRPLPDLTNPGSFAKISKHEHNDSMNDLAVTADIACKSLIIYWIFGKMLWIKIYFCFLLLPLLTFSMNSMKTV